MTMKDCIDDEAERRRAGVKRALSQENHAAVNQRYPGGTLEYCCRCDCATGRAGAGDGSLYTDSDGPFCEDCFEAGEKEGSFA